MRKGDEFLFEKWASVAEVFRCNKEKPVLGFPMPQLLPRHLALVGERLLVLQAHPTKVGVGLVTSNHHVTELSKLSFNKSRPKRLALVYKGDRRRVYHVEDYAGFQRALKRSLRKCVR